MQKYWWVGGYLLALENHEKELQKQLLAEQNRIVEWEKTLEEITWP